MATKTITIMEDAYELLKRAKKEGESFSDTIRRTYSKEARREEFFGVWDREFGDRVEMAMNERRLAEKKERPLGVK